MSDRSESRRWRWLAVAGFGCAVLSCAIGSYLPGHDNGTASRLVPADTAVSDRMPSNWLPGRSSKLTAELLPQSFMRADKLPVVDIDISKIPDGLTERGTSFYLGDNYWLTARHVINSECTRIIMIAGGKNVDANIKFLDRNADLAVVQAQPPSGPALPIGSDDPDEGSSGYTFGFPQGALGATSVEYLGRTHMKLGGLLSGSAPVLAWTETARYPDLDSLAGISGGPTLDSNGNVIGVMVAASVDRGRNFTVAPEVLREVVSELVGDDPIPGQEPAREVVSPPVELKKSAEAMSKDARIVETYCIPQDLAGK